MTRWAKMSEKKKVLWWGRFDPGYSRNRVYISLFKKLGWEVDFFFVKVWPRFGDVEAFLRGLQFRAKPDLVWVPVARQRDVLAACRWAHRRGIPVIFDPMISAWDKKVLEQLKWKAEEPRAKKLSTCRASVCACCSPVPMSPCSSRRMEVAEWRSGGVEELLNHPITQSPNHPLFASSTTVRICRCMARSTSWRRRA